MASLLLPVDGGELGRPGPVGELGTVKVSLGPGAVQGEEAVTVALKLGPE